LGQPKVEAKVEVKLDVKTEKPATLR
jgi:hypothetical protein